MSFFEPLPITPVGIARMEDIGGLLAEFDGYEPDQNYNFARRVTPGKEEWKIVEPESAPPITPLPLVIQRMLKATWKYAEPARDNVRGMVPSQVGQGGIAIGARSHGITIGTRGRPVPQGAPTQFAPQQRPTTPIDAAGNLHGIQTTFPSDSAIASDWKLFETIPRTHAVTFRGDSRSPDAVITKAGGFYPPNSRTDKSYIEKNIFNAFKDYLKRRWNRDLTKEEFLRSVVAAGVMEGDKKLLVDYLMWRKITDKEAVHLGRMVETECLKGYISTARGIDTALFFATGYYANPGWLYLTVVHSGFVVPLGDKNYWGTEEGEVAQWGPIPAQRIVGFLHVQSNGIPDGPIFIRRSFRQAQRKAFERMFKVMSGMTPAQGAA
jgi:hypothetical protein